MVGKAAYGFDFDHHAQRQQQVSISVALARFGLIVVLIFSALIAVAGSLLLLYGWTHNETVFQGVSVAGADLGGLNQQQATERVASQVKAVAPAQVVLTYQGQRWTVPASSLGITYDARTTAQNALQVGHTGSLWTKTRDWLTSVISGNDIPVNYTINDGAVFTTLQGLSSNVIRPPHDAVYVFGSDKSLSIQDGTPGVSIDVAATIDTIRGRVGNLSSTPVEIVTQQVNPTITAATLQPSLKQVDQMVSTPFTLTNGGDKWQIPSETLREMLVVNDGSAASQISISDTALKTYVTQIAAQVKTSGQNAGVRWETDHFAVTPSTDRQVLDPGKTAANIVTALQDGKHEIPVAVTSAPADVVEADAEDAVNRAQQMVSQPLTLTWAGGKQDLTAAQLASVMTFTAQPDQNPKIAVGVNQDAVSGVLDSLRAKVETPAKDADLRYLNGAVTVVSAEQPGTSLNVEASAASIEAALAGGAHTAEIKTDPVAPKVTAAMASTIDIKEKLSSGQTYYGGSVANRAFNVELAISRVNGALIPPGGTFSFDGTVGAVDLDHGYKVGYGIVGTTDGSVSTVPSVGGGICQVATTLFHAAFWAGMPIVQRSWHLYWIPLYGQAPSGITGLDATVDTDVGLDLKFKNPTDHWLAVKASADGTWVRFELWGTDPGWTVKVDDPVVTNVVKANTAMQYEQSDQLPAGTSVLVEHAEDGFDVTIHRQVLKDGKVIDDLTLNSHYRPSENVTLQGTGT